VEGAAGEERRQQGDGDGGRSAAPAQSPDVRRRPRLGAAAARRQRNKATRVVDYNMSGFPLLTATARPVPPL
jgi:hypothetical protein